ncbi:MAG: hypothetical protein IJP38_02455 [Oscillospiraceae bacterium]|nr:hypothetical protein [Oscillospiraceae bacterium]
MAWQIVKDSFRLLKIDLNRYILFCFIAFLISLLGTFVKNNHWAFIFIILFLQLLFVDIPLFVVFFRIFSPKSPQPIIPRRAASFLFTALIYAGALTAINLTPLNSNFNDVVMLPMTLWLHFIWIEMIKNNSGIKDAVRNSFQTFLDAPIKSIWLLVKIYIIEEIIFGGIGVILGLILSLLLLLFSRFSGISGELFLMIFGFIQTLLSPYFVIRTCCYYISVSSKNTCK